MDKQEFILTHGLSIIKNIKKIHIIVFNVSFTLDHTGGPTQHWKFFLLKH
jgi:hypothetical protein